MFKNHLKWYAGQPYMISIWEHMWHRIYTRLDDERDEILATGEYLNMKQMNHLEIAENHSCVLEAYLNEAHQLRNNVRRMADPIKWKFNLVLNKDE